MPTYEIDYEYDITEYANVQLAADNEEQAKEFGEEYVRDTYDDVHNIKVTGVKLI